MGGQACQCAPPCLGEADGCGENHCETVRGGALLTPVPLPLLLPVLLLADTHSLVHPAVQGCKVEAGFQQA